MLIEFGVMALTMVTECGLQSNVRLGRLMTKCKDSSGTVLLGVVSLPPSLTRGSTESPVS